MNKVNRNEEIMVMINFLEGTIDIKTKSKGKMNIIKNDDLKTGKYYLTCWFYQPGHKVEI